MPPAAIFSTWGDIVAIASLTLTACGFGGTLWQIRAAVAAARESTSATLAATRATSQAVQQLAATNLVVLNQQLRDLEIELRDAATRDDRANLHRLLVRWREKAAWTQGVLETIDAELDLSQQLKASRSRALVAADRLTDTTEKPSLVMGPTLETIGEVCDEIGRVGGGVATGVGESAKRSVALMRMQHETLLVPDDVLYEREATVACREIWIMTLDLQKDMPRGASGRSFYDAVRHNVTKRGITYRYVVRDEGGVRERAETEFLPLFPADIREDHVKVYFLEEDRWDRLPYIDGDFGIYNPTREPSGTPVEAYFAFPNTERTLWVNVSSEIAERWVERIRPILERQV